MWSEKPLHPERRTRVARGERRIVREFLGPDHGVPMNEWYHVACSRAVEQLVILEVRRDTGWFELPGRGD